MVIQRWHDQKFNRLLDAELVKYMYRIGARGEAISKHLISGSLDPTDKSAAYQTLKAVDTGRLMNSLTFEVDTKSRVVRIGTNVKYAIYVFLGTIHMGARPVLRTMLQMLRLEMRSWR